MKLQTSISRQVVKMLSVVLIFFVVTWLPLQSFSLITHLFPGTRQNILNKSREYYIFVGSFFAFHWLAMAHSCLNPIIYCFMNNKFRSDLCDLLWSQQHETRSSQLDSSDLQSGKSQQATNETADSRSPTRNAIYNCPEESSRVASLNIDGAGDELAQRRANLANRLMITSNELRPSRFAEMNDAVDVIDELDEPDEQRDEREHFCDRSPRWAVVFKKAAGQQRPKGSPAEQSSGPHQQYWQQKHPGQHQEQHQRAKPKPMLELKSKSPPEGTRNQPGAANV